MQCPPLCPHVHKRLLAALIISALSWCHSNLWTGLLLTTMTTANDTLSIWQTPPQAAALLLRYWRKTLPSHLWPLHATHNNTCLFNKDFGRCKGDKPCEYILYALLNVLEHVMIICLFKSPRSQPCFNSLLSQMRAVRCCKPIPKGQSFILSVRKLVLASYYSQREPSPCFWHYAILFMHLAFYVSARQTGWSGERSRVGDRAGDSCTINPGYQVDHKGYICNVVNLPEMKAPAPESNANLWTIWRQKKTTKGYSFFFKYTSDHIPLWLIVKWPLVIHCYLFFFKRDNYLYCLN